MSEYIHCRLRNSLCAKLIRGQLKLWDQTSGVRPTSGTRAAVATLVFNFPTINTLSVGDFFQTDWPPTLRRTWRPTTRLTPTPTPTLRPTSRLAPWSRPRSWVRIDGCCSVTVRAYLHCFQNCLVSQPDETDWTCYYVPSSALGWHLLGNPMFSVDTTHEHQRKQNSLDFKKRAAIAQWTWLQRKRGFTAIVIWYC